jgi:hypothetical protein
LDLNNSTVAKKDDMKVTFGHTILMMFVLLLMTTSCQTEKISQAELKLERYVVKISDLPEGWEFSGEDWNYKFGSESYLAAYGIPNSNMIRFGHTIAVYSDETQAENSYPKWEDEWFSATEKWTGAEFTPSDPKDVYRFECQQILSDKSIVSCSFLQRHKEFIVSILATLDGKAMTLSQLNEILIVLDKRINEVNLNE